MAPRFEVLSTQMPSGLCPGLSGTVLHMSPGLPTQQEPPGKALVGEPRTQQLGVDADLLYFSGVTMAKLFRPC